MNLSSIKTNYQWKYVFLSMFMAFIVCGSFAFYKYHKNNKIDIKSAENNQAKITSTTNSRDNDSEDPIWDFEDDEYIPGFSREYTNRNTTKMNTQNNKTKNHSKTNSSRNTSQTKKTTRSTTSTTKQFTTSKTTTEKEIEQTTIKPTETTQSTESSSSDLSTKGEETEDEY